MKKFISKLLGYFRSLIYSEEEFDTFNGLICPICGCQDIKYIRTSWTYSNPRHGFKCKKCGFIILEDDIGDGLTLVLYNWNRTYELINEFNKDNAVLYDVNHSNC